MILIKMNLSNIKTFEKKFKILLSYNYIKLNKNYYFYLSF